jgi:hypothetical protein
MRPIPCFEKVKMPALNQTNPCGPNNHFEKSMSFFQGILLSGEGGVESKKKFEMRGGLTKSPPLRE